MHFNLHGTMSIAAGIVNIFMGCLVLVSNPRSKANVTFFGLTIATCMWVVNFGLLSMVPPGPHAYTWVGIAYMGVPFISPFVYLFSLNWTDNKFPAFKISFIFLLAGFYAVWMQIDKEVIFSIAVSTWGNFVRVKRNPTAVIYYTTFIVFFVLTAWAGIRNLLRFWKTCNNPSRRSQVKFLFVGFCIAYVGIIDFLIKFGLDFYPFGYLCLTGLISFITYTIFNHQFFNINLIVRKITLISIVYVFILAFVTPLLIFAFKKTLPDISHSHLVFLLIMSLICGAIFSMGPTIYAILVRNNSWIRDQLGTGLIHELKSPLGSISGAVEVMSGKNFSSMPEPVKEYIAMINANTARLLGFVDNLIQLPKIQDGRLSMERQYCDLNDVVGEIVQLSQPFAEAKKIQFDLDQKESLLFFDPKYISIVVSNLINNAIKFSTEGGIIQIRYSENASEIFCSIRDFGIGVASRDELQKMFHLFYQGKHSVKGAGIGLSISKAWVEAHGGRIWAESEGLGKGTTVTFTLPTE